MKNDKKERQQLFTRRTIMLTAGKALALGALGAKLFHLQVVESSTYTKLAEGNRIKLVPIIARRGRILDRNDKVIVDGVPRYQLEFDPPEKDMAEENFLEIAKIMKLPKYRLDEILKEIRSPSPRYPIVIDNYMSWENISSIKVRQYKLTGADIHFVESRNYLFPEAASHVIGYIGPLSNPSEEDKDKYGKLYLNPDFRVGRAGIELAHEDTLAGTPGYKEVEVDAHGKIIRELDSKPFVSGNQVKTTLDIDLQNLAKQLMTGKGGLVREGASAVMIDIKNGDVLVMCSTPGFDPHMFISGISNEDWKKIISDPDKPLINKSISNQYPPGSTFKPYVAIGALSEGVLNPNEEFYCPGHLDYGNRRFHCWKPEGHGAVNLEKGIAQSCNVYFYQAAIRLKIDNIAKYARLMGLGKKTGIELPSEKNGLIADTKWKKQVLKQDWWDGETLSIGIGQGYNLVTPLQMAVGVARIASAGRRVEPRLVIDSNSYDYEFPFVQGVNSDYVKLVRQGMINVVNAPYGTAYRLRNLEPELMFGGKTGTVQIKGNKKNTFVKDLPTIRAERHHGMFTGFGPASNPRFACAVVVEHGGFGAQSAAPIGKELLTAAMKKYSTI